MSRVIRALCAAPAAAAASPDLAFAPSVAATIVIDHATPAARLLNPGTGLAVCAGIHHPL